MVPPGLYRGRWCARSLSFDSKGVTVQFGVDLRRSGAAASVPPAAEPLRPAAGPVDLEALAELLAPMVLARVLPALAGPALVPVEALPVAAETAAGGHFPNLEAEIAAVHAALDAAPAVSGPDLEAEPVPVVVVHGADALAECDAYFEARDAADLEAAAVAGPLELVEVLEAEPVNLSELVGFDVTAGPVALTPLELVVADINAALALELADLPPTTIPPCEVEARYAAEYDVADAAHTRAYAERSRLLNDDRKDLERKLKDAQKNLATAADRKDPEAYAAKWSGIVADREAALAALAARCRELDSALESASAAMATARAGRFELEAVRERAEREASALHSAACARAKTARIEAAVAHALPGTVTLPSKDLIAAARATAKACSARSINPVLGYMELSLLEDRLRLRCTDGDLTVTRWLEASDAVLPVPVLVPARLLLDTVAKMPGAGRKGSTVSLCFEPRAGRDGVEYACAAVVGDRKVNLTCLGADNFPELPDYSDSLLVTLSSAVLKRSLIQTVFSAIKESSTDGVHYTNGVLLSFKAGRLDMVATDGHRLALKRSDGLAGCAERDLLLPARAADLLEKMLLEDYDAVVELYQTKGMAHFVFGGAVLSTSLLDVKFPDYERVIPRDIDTRLHLSREALLDTLPGALIVCRQKDQNPVCKFEVNEAKDRLLISADAGEIGRFDDSLACEVAGGGFKIALNPAYILDSIKVLGGDQVTLNWISEVNPLMVTSPRDPDWTYIVMPIRLD